MTTFLEDMIQIAEDENKLFESMLKIEFRKAEVVRESALHEDDNNAIDAEYKEASDDNKSTDLTTTDSNSNNSSDEADKEADKKFSEKVTELIRKLLTAIQKAAEKIMNKIKQFIYSDNKIMQKFKEALSNKDNLAGFEGIDNFAAPNLDWSFDEDSIKDFLDLMNQMTERHFLVMGNHSDSNKKADEIFIDCNNALSNPIDNWNKDGSANFDFNKAIDNLVNGKLSKPVFIMVKRIGGLLGALRTIDAKDLYAHGSDKKEYIDYINNAREVAKKVLSTHIQYFKAIRQAIIVCGTYAVKKASTGNANEETATESANNLAFVAGTISEAYLDEQFEF